MTAPIPNFLTATHDWATKCADLSYDERRMADAYLLEALLMLVTLDADAIDFRPLHERAYGAMDRAVAAVKEMRHG